EVERFQRWIIPSLMANGNWRGEAIGRRKDGSSYPQEVSLSQVHEGGLVCVVRDITDRKKTEKRKAFVGDYTTTLTESMDYKETIDRVVTLALPQFCDFCILGLRSSGNWNEQKLIEYSANQVKTPDPKDLDRLKSFPFKKFENAPAFRILSDE